MNLASSATRIRRGAGTDATRHARAKPLVSGTGPEDCPFCVGHLGRSAELYDEVLFRDKLVNVVPDLSPLCPGHLLVAARQHVLSMAELGPTRLGKLALRLSDLGTKLSPEFVDQGNYFLFEHGTPQDRGGSGACIDHAHLHMLPMEDQMSDQLTSALSWQSIPRLKDLARFQGVGYAYLGIKGSHYVYPSSNIGSQWLRRQVCEALNRDDWDWALTKSDVELHETLERGRRAL